MQDDEETFLKKLHFQELVEEYKQKRDQLLKEIQKECEEKHSELYENKSRGILEDKYHRMLLNASIFPFTQVGLLPADLDYIYVRGSPLAEKGVKNVDFLIVSLSKKITIFGEVKASISDPNVVIDEMKERMQAIQDNLDCVRNYIQDISTVEYVLVVQSHDAQHMSNTILRKKINIKLWHVGGIDLQRLSLFVPATDDATRRSLMHIDDKLNRALSDVRTSMQFKTFFPESHPVAKMELLTAIDKGRIDEIFTLDDIISIVKRELDNLSEEQIKEESASILKLAIDIQFVKAVDEMRYKIQSRYKKPESRYDELKEKWIEYSITMKKEKEKADSLKKLQEQMLMKKKTKYRTLEEFDLK